MDSLDNPNPVVYGEVSSGQPGDHVLLSELAERCDDLARDQLDAEEVFELIRHLNDPEHPYSLEQLKVLERSMIAVDEKKQHIAVSFTPTIPHCSQATLIGLMIRVKLLRCLPERYKVDVSITPGTHNTEAAINKQLNDKERVAAALENPNLLSVINRGIAGTDKWTSIIDL
eukprot:GDKI01033953.1.p1 GENE.GDKI01033953.1~~GDKI01033953.1.p1  ORF type:complete len:172 (-),score=57.78 GDKI01033953.1:329-844(-)